VGSNAWDRAQEAIAHAHQRATERDEDVITPDTAVSPFDASATTVLPHGLAARGGSDPDLTQRIPQRDGHPRHRAGHGNGSRNGHARPRVDPNDPDDARTVRFSARERTHPGTSPFPANPFPGGPGPSRDEHGGRDGDGGPEAGETPAAEPRRPWWRRLFGR
jgi:hypothetical protein